MTLATAFAKTKQIMSGNNELSQFFQFMPSAEVSAEKNQTLNLDSKALSLKATCKNEKKIVNKMPTGF